MYKLSYANICAPDGTGFNYPPKKFRAIKRGKFLNVLTYTSQYIETRQVLSQNLLDRKFSIDSSG